MEDIGVKERIRFVLSYYKKSIADLASGNENARVRLTRQINGKSEITIDVLTMLLQEFQDVSAEWLLRSEGAMLISEIRTPKIYTQGGSVNTGNANDHSSISMGVDKEGKNMYERLLDEQAAHYSDLLAEKDKRINELTEYIGTFKMFVAAITPAPRIKK